MKNRNFFYDILRDKGSLKFSMTKVLALLFSIFLILYLSVEIFYNDKTIDHTLIIQLIGLIAGLVGLKNNWGVGDNSKKTSEMPEVTPYEPMVVDSKSDDKDEGSF